MYMVMCAIHMYFAIAAIEASDEIVERVVTSSIALDDRQQDIETALEGVVNLATTVLEDCEISGADCQGLPHPSIFTFTTVNVSVVSACMNFLNIMCINERTYVGTLALKSL